MFSALAPDSSSWAPGSSVIEAPPRIRAMIGAAVVLALGRPAVVLRQVLEHVQHAVLAEVGQRPPRRLEEAELLHLGPDAPFAARLAGLGERDDEVVAAANGLEGSVVKAAAPGAGFASSWRGVRADGVDESMGHRVLRDKCDAGDTDAVVAE